MEGSGLIAVEAAHRIPGISVDNAPGLVNFQSWAASEIWALGLDKRRRRTRLQTSYLIMVEISAAPDPGMYQIHI